MNNKGVMFSKFDAYHFADIAYVFYNLTLVVNFTEDIRVELVTVKCKYYKYEEIGGGG